MTTLHQRIGIVSRLKLLLECSKKVDLPGWHFTSSDRAYTAMANKLLEATKLLLRQYIDLHIKYDVTRDILTLTMHRGILAPEGYYDPRIVTVRELSTLSFDEVQNTALTLGIDTILIILTGRPVEEVMRVLDPEAIFSTEGTEDRIAVNVSATLEWVYSRDTGQWHTSSIEPESIPSVPP